MFSLKNHYFGPDVNATATWKISAHDGQQFRSRNFHFARHTRCSLQGPGLPIASVNLAEAKTSRAAPKSINAAKNPDGRILEHNEYMDDGLHERTYNTNVEH